MKRNKFTITIVGHGYVGLVTAAVWADLGHKVYVIGRNREKINKLNHGEVYFYEPGLKKLLQRNLKSQRLKFTLNYQEALTNTDMVIVCVNTPGNHDGGADISAVINVSKKIIKNLQANFTVLAIKSTVPVGTNRKLLKLLKKYQKPGKRFAIVSLPEFLREGTAIKDTLHPHRIIIGVEDKRAEKLLLTFHRRFKAPILITNLESAEIIKYASNAFLSMKISFANLLSFLCEKTGANIEEVIKGMTMDKRINPHFFKAGIGFGGSCFPKDIKALTRILNKYQIDASLLNGVGKINQLAWQNAAHKTLKLVGSLKNKTVALWGLAFKPGTDDIREAPALKIIDWLLKKGAKIKAYDPQAMKNTLQKFDNVLYCKNALAAVENADVLIIATEWPEFKKVDWQLVKHRLKKPNIVDGRNLYYPDKMKQMGYNYLSSGR